MSYAALGYDVELDTPLGKKTVSFDLDKVSRDVTAAMVAQGWPVLEQRVRQAMPGLVDDGITLAVPRVKQEIKAEAKELFLPFVIGLGAVAVVGWWLLR